MQKGKDKPVPALEYRVFIPFYGRDATARSRILQRWSTPDFSVMRLIYFLEFDFFTRGE
jgi:hypothetical protein